jgi:hypothetical protein
MYAHKLHLPKNNPQWLVATPMLQAPLCCDPLRDLDMNGVDADTAFLGERRSRRRQQQGVWN